MVGLLTSTNVGDQVPDALLGEELGEQAGPVGLNAEACCLHNSGNVISLRMTYTMSLIWSTIEPATSESRHTYSNIKPVIVQDQGSISAGKLGGRHPERYLSSVGALTGSRPPSRRGIW